MLQSMVNRYKVVGASTGLAIHLWAIIQGGYLAALMSDLVPATSCAIAMGLLGLDLTLPGSTHAQVRGLANYTSFDCCHVGRCQSAAVKAISVGSICSVQMVLT